MLSCIVVGMRTLREGIQGVLSCVVVGVRTLREGNLTHNRQCTCDLQSSYYSDEGVDVNPDYCLYKHCRNGSVLAFNGMCDLGVLSHRHMCPCRDKES